MYDPQRMLISSFLAQLLPRCAEPAEAAAAWSAAREALRRISEAESELEAAVEGRDRAALEALIEEWRADRRPMPAHDRELLKGAMTTFRKSLKVKRLDAESTIGGGPMSAGRRSTIAGILPPERFAKDVWQELARQKRLIALRNGTYTLPPE
jgi:hypothetical protein